jgi:hypothetical protein
LPTKPFVAMDHITSNTMKNPKLQFITEPSVALAKSTIFLKTAENEYSNKELIPAATFIYYSLFHFSLALMWLFADSLPPTLFDKLCNRQEQGLELPSTDISHNKIKNFLCSGQLDIKDKSICQLFCEAQKLREFVNYGPKVQYKGNRPIIKSSHVDKNEVGNLLKRVPPIYFNTVKQLSPKTALSGNLFAISIDESKKLIKGNNFPFNGWCSDNVINESLKFLNELLKETGVIIE